MSTGIYSKYSTRISEISWRKFCIFGLSQIKNVALVKQQDVQISKQPIKKDAWVPEWGSGHLKLAVPLVKLGGIHRLTPSPRRLAGQPPWFLGLVADQLGNICVIDTVLWIIPDKYKQAEAQGLDYEFIMLLDKTRWGLACTVVDTALTISTEEVNWSGRTRKRTWLAGMLIDNMCAVLDVDALIIMLDKLSAQARN